MPESSSGGVERSHPGYAGVSAHESSAFPGLVAVALFLYALQRGRTPARKSDMRVLLTLSIVFFAFSLGPRLLFRENTPVPFAY